MATSFKEQINRDIIVKGIVEGKSYEEIGELIGSKAKSKRDSVYKKIRHTPTIKRDIIIQLEEKRQQILDAMIPQKAETQNLVQLSTSLGIITDKIQLLRGDPTQRIETLPRLVIDEVEENEIKPPIPEQIK